MNAIFDSSIVIDYLNGIRQAKIEASLYTSISISLITWIEVMAGTDSSDEQATRVVLAGYEFLPITRNVSERAFRLRRNGKLKLPDAIILATAQEAGLLLVTRNSRDFSATDPQIRIPYII